MYNHIYTTRTIIIKSSLIGEANQLYFLLTRDFGLIIATAQGVRLAQSKLKGHLQDMSLTNTSLVKGKEFWRLTSAEVISRPIFLIDNQKTRVVKNIFSLLIRLIQGEEKNESLFSLLENFYFFISESNLTITDLKILETMTVLRILYHLGYFKEHFDLESFAKDILYSPEIVEHFKQYNVTAVREINEALQATNL